MPEAISAEIAIEMLMGADGISNVVITEMQIGSHSGHPECVHLAGRRDAAVVVWQVLAVVVERIGVGGARHDEPRHLAPWPDKAFVSECQSERYRRRKVTHDVTDVRPCRG